ncbi:L-threonine 3-dehydrogenase [bacterium]|nr:L-threonine 3-dehydrogenase [bacterium]
MKALVKEKPGKGLVLKDVPDPSPGEGEVLIRIRAAGICGTDVHIYDWDEWSRNRIHPPVITGHELVGEVVALGKSTHHIPIGQRVSAEGHIACGHCEFCRTGQAHICRDVEIIGVDRDGCFAEYMSMDAGNLWPVPDAIPDHIASIFDPVGNAMHTVMAEPVSGKSVLITGAGAIGLFAVAIARSVGASTIMVIEPNAFKREHARKAGADVLIDPSDEHLEDIVLSHTDGLGPQILLEMSGHPDAINTGFRLLRNGGCACVLGIPPGKVTFDWAKDIVFKGITIKAINGRRMYDTWFQTQNFMLREQERVNRLITHRLPFVDFERGFDLLHRGEAVKVVLEMNDDPK